MKNGLNSNILLFEEKTPGEVQREIAARVRRRRLELDLTQKAFAARSGIPLATYRRFELTGEISLRNLILLSIPLRMTADFDGLFSERRYRSIDEVIDEARGKERKRGRRNDY